MSATQVLAPVVVKTILFTTDFSPASRTALAAATSLARRFEANLVLLHVIPPHVRQPIPMDTVDLTLDPEHHQAERKLLKLENTPEVQSVPHRVMLRRGELWPVCADVINTFLADMIVVGTRGRGGLMKLLLGSGAEQILRRSRIPVLTVGPDAGAHCAGQIRSVVLATDLSAPNDAILQFAIAFAAGGKLTLVHAVEDVEGVLVARDPSELLTGFEERLRASLPPATSIDVNVVCRFGLAPELILQAASETQADLICMGVHSTRALASATHLPWSVGHTVVAHAPCPVLTVSH